MTWDQVSLFHNKFLLCVCLGHWQSWGLTHFMLFYFRKAHNPLTKKYLSMNSLSLLFPSVWSLWPLWPPQHVLSLFYHRRVLKDTGSEHQAAAARGHGGGTGERGCVSLPVSHLISRLLCSSLLCTGHMYSRQRRREVDGPLCWEASITSPVTMQKNDHPASGTEQTVMCGLRNK